MEKLLFGALVSVVSLTLGAQVVFAAKAKYEEGEISGEVSISGVLSFSGIHTMPSPARMDLSKLTTFLPGNTKVTALHPYVGEVTQEITVIGGAEAKAEYELASK